MSTGESWDMLLSEMMQGYTIYN